MNTTMITSMINNGQVAKAVLLLEREAQEQTPIEQLEFIPLEHLRCSPILMNRYGRQLLDAGKLQEASRVVNVNMQTSAEFGMTKHFLQTLALNVQINLRLGNGGSIAELLYYLNEEYVRENENCDGIVPLTLALASRYLDKPVNPEKLLVAALHMFSADEDLSGMGQTLIQICWQDPDFMADPSFQRMYLTFKAAGMHNIIGASYLRLINMIRACRSRDSEELVTLLNLPVPDMSKLPIYDWFMYAAVHKMVESLTSIKAPLVQRCTVDLTAESGSLDVGTSFWVEMIKYFDKPSKLGLENIDRMAESCKLPAHEVMQRKLLADSSQEQQPTALEINCFNGFKVRTSMTNQHQTLRWKRKKSLELLAFLLVQPARGASKDKIQYGLFAQVLPGKVNNHIGVAIHHVNQLFFEQTGIPHLVHLKDGYLSLTGNVSFQVDFKLYIEHIRKADMLWDQQKVEAAKLYEEAYRTYGYFLPELDFVDWVEDFRSDLSLEQSGLIKKLASHSITLHQYAHAERLYKEALVLEPYNIETYENLISLCRLQSKDYEARQWELKLELTIQEMEE